MIALPVPLFRAPPGKAYCGPVAAKMVLEYYGIKLSIKQIAQRMKAKSRGGVFMTNMASFFLRQNCDVRAILWSSTSFPSRFVDLPEENINKEVLRWCRRKIIKKNDIPWRQSFRSFIKQGGVLRFRVFDSFSIPTLRAALKRREPPILGVESAVLWGDWERLGPCDHTVVLVKIDSKRATIQDCVFGKFEVDTELLRFACFHATEPAILFIKRPRPE